MASPSSSDIERAGRCNCKGCGIARQQGREDAALDVLKFLSYVPGAALLAAQAARGKDK